MLAGRTVLPSPVLSPVFPACGPGGAVAMSWASHVVITVAVCSVCVALCQFPRHSLWASVCPLHVCRVCVGHEPLWGPPGSPVLREYV